MKRGFRIAGFVLNAFLRASIVAFLVDIRGIRDRLDWWRRPRTP